MIKSINFKNFFGGLLLTATFVFIVYWFQSVRIWHEYYFTPSAFYTIYHLLKALLFFYLFLIIYTTGSLVVSLLSRKIGMPKLSSIDMFIIYAFVGASVIQIIMFILGILKLYYTITALLITVPLVFCSYSHCINFYAYLKQTLQTSLKICKEEGKIYTLTFTILCVLTALQVIYVFISKGLIPDMQVTDTLMNYLPYYQHVIDTHGNFQTGKYWFHYYTSKGATLFYLLALLSDIQAVQLVGFFYYLMLALIVYSLILRFVSTYEELWAIFGLLLVFSSSLMLNEGMPLTEVGSFGILSVDFSKTHIITSAKMLFLVWLSTILLTDKQQITNIQVTALLSIVIIAFSILSTLSGGWTAPFFALIFIILIFKKEDKSKYYVMFIAFVISVVSVCTILIYNLLNTGLAEHSPFYFFYKYRLSSILESWISKHYLELGALIVKYSGHYTSDISTIDISRLFKNILYLIYDNSMLPFPLYIVVAFIVASITKSAFRFIPIIILCLLNLLYLTIHGHDSVYRYMGPIIIAVKSFIYVYVLSHLFYLFDKYKKEINIFLLFVCLCFLINSVINQKTILTIKDKIDFLTGKLSYAEIYDKRWIVNTSAKKILSLIDRNEKVLTLTEMFGIIVTPTGQFQVPNHADYITSSNDFLQLIKTNDSDVIKYVFKKYNINYFLIWFKTRPFSEFYLPLFDKESMSKNLRILAYGDDLLLLTLHDKGSMINEEINEIIQKFRYLNSTWNTSQAYFHFKNIIINEK